MKSNSLAHLADHVVLREFAALVAQDRTTTAKLLAYLAEVDARRLYLPAAYPSMYLYCVRELHMSEDVALRRIQAARAARRFPAILPAVADGRLHLTAVALLAPYFTPENADALLAAAAHQTKAGIQQLLADRFPRPDVPTQLAPLAASPTAFEHALANVQTLACQHAPAHVGASHDPSSTAGEVGPGPVGLLNTQMPDSQAAVSELALNGQLVSKPVATAAVLSAAPRPKLAPLSPGRFALQVTISQAAHDKLRYAQALLGHAVPSGDLSQVLDRVLGLAIAQLEKRRFAAASQTRASARATSRHAKPDGRHIPADVRRQVWQRDKGQCTFVSENGQRCPARMRLEFDHAKPFAQGGLARLENLRLRCRAHNQYMAERAFGAGFMARKREETRHKAAQERTKTHVQPAAPGHL